MFRGRVAIVLAGTMAMLGLNLAVAAPPAFAATSVTPGAVTPNPAEAGANSTYTIKMTASTSLPAGGTITLVAPSETDFSTSSANYSIAVNDSHAATVASVAASPAGGGGGTNDQVVITLATSTIAAGDQITVTATQTTNPQAASTSYTIQESTSADTTPVASASYTITASIPAYILVKQGSPDSAVINTAYATALGALVTDQYYNPVPNATVTFTAPGPTTTSSPSGTFASCPQNVTGTNATPANECIVNTAGNGVAIASTFTANSHAGAITPLNATVATGTGTATTSPGFQLTNVASGTPVTGGPVTVSPNVEGSTTAQYTIGLTTNSAIPTGDYIQLIAPTGTTFPSPCGPCNYTVTYGTSTQTSVTVSSVATSTSTTPPGEQVQISLLATAADAIPAHQPVTITITGVTNPTKASPSYNIEESDQVDTPEVGSNSYAIAPGPASSITAVSGGGQHAPVYGQFAAPLVAVVKDAAGNPVSEGTPVTFTLPTTTTAATGYFPNSTSTQTNFTNASGQATSSSVTANGVTGNWTAVAAINAGGVKTANYALVNDVASTATSLVVTSGGRQTAQIGSAFGAPFVVTAKDAQGHPVPGAAVSFTTPSSGASASFAGANPHLVHVTANSQGQAYSPTFTADTTAGTWTISASVSATASTSAQETNTAGAPTGLVSVQGTGLSAHLTTFFAKRLEAKVVDAFGNGVAGQYVTFTTPYFVHPTGIFVGQPFGAALAVTVQTGPDGVAVAPALLSSVLPGTFQATATATINGAAQSVGYHLASTDGYWLAGSNGSVQRFGDAPSLGSLAGTKLAQPIVGIADVPLGIGYWMVASDGGIFSFGPSAHFHGSMGGTPLNKPIVAIAATPDGLGYYMVASDGGIFAFGDAHFHGSMGGQPLNKPIVGMTVTADGDGYWLVASDGGLFAFGDARFRGSMGGTPLNKPVVGMSATPDGEGYYMVASDGGIFAFGDATYFGSTGNIHLSQPIVGMTAAPSGLGYWFVASDGGVFNYGPEAAFFGSGSGVGEPVIGIAEG